MRIKSLFFGLILTLLASEYVLSSIIYKKYNLTRKDLNAVGNKQSKEKNEPIPIDSTFNFNENQGENGRKWVEKKSEKWILLVSFCFGFVLFAGFWMRRYQSNAKERREMRMNLENLKRELKEKNEKERKMMEKSEESEVEEERESKEKDEGNTEKEDKVNEKEGEETEKRGEKVTEKEKKMEEGKEEPDAIDKEDSKEMIIRSNQSTDIVKFPKKKGGSLSLYRKRNAPRRVPARSQSSLGLEALVEHQKEETEKRERDEHFGSFCKLVFIIPQLTLFAWAVVLYWNVDSFLTNAGSFREAQKIFEGSDGILSWVNYFGYKDVFASVYQYAIILVLLGGAAITIALLSLIAKIPLLPYLVGVWLFRMYFRSVARLLIFDAIILLLVTYCFLSTLYKKNKWADRWTIRKIVWIAACFASVFAGYHAANTDFYVNPDAEYESIVDVYILNPYWPRNI